MKLIFTILIFGMIFLPIIFLIDDMCTKQSEKKKYNIQDERNMLDEAQWIKKVIKSCKTYKQLIVADGLRDALLHKYKNKVDRDLLYKINNELNCDWEVMADIASYD